MESLVVFARQPVAGAVKTRLAESIGDAAAVQLYCGFLEDTVTTCANWRKQTVGADPNRRLVFAVDPSADDPLIAELARRGGMHVVEQGEGDLGDRLKRAMDAEFARGARSVCVIGSDAPTLPRSHLDHAFRALHFEPAVFGPSFDGGYWLVGAQRPAPDLFTSIPWSSDLTLDASLRHLRRSKTHGHLLPYWYDVDDAPDLKRLVTQVVADRYERPDAHAATYQALLACEQIPKEDVDALAVVARAKATDPEEA